MYEVMNMKDLSLEEMEELRQDLLFYLDLEKNPDDHRFWQVRADPPF
jgi:hypothetical protein